MVLPKMQICTKTPKLDCLHITKSYENPCGQPIKQRRTF